MAAVRCLGADIWWWITDILVIFTAALKIQNTTVKGLLLYYITVFVLYPVEYKVSNTYYSLLSRSSVEAAMLDYRVFH